MEQSLEKDCWKFGNEQGRSMRLALVKQRTRMTHSGSAVKYVVYESGCGEKSVWTIEGWEINWSRLPITEGMVQLPRGSARARKVAKQQIGVTFNSRAQDGVIFSHKSRKTFFCFLARVPFNFEFVQFLQLLKKTSVARLRWPHPFWFGKPSAGHKKGARGSLPARGPILWPPLM